MIGLLVALAGVTGVVWGFWPIVRPLPVRPSETRLAMLEAQVLDDLPTLPVTEEERHAGAYSEEAMLVRDVRRITGLTEVSYGPVFRKVIRDGRVFRVYPDGRQQYIGPPHKMRRSG